MKKFIVILIWILYPGAMVYITCIDSGREWVAYKTQPLILTGLWVYAIMASILGIKLWITPENKID
jgi:hypothetical protein